MITLLLLTLSCAPTKIVNTSGHAWNAEDDSNLARAKVRCGEIYKGFPCVSWIKKYNIRQYSVSCGKEKK